MFEEIELGDLWYFAHPYTGVDKRAEVANFHLCCIRSAKLIEMGYMIYSPIAHTHPIHMAWPRFLNEDERELWIQLDNLVIARTDFKGIILAPLWPSSAGCVGERDLFAAVHKPILEYGDIVKLVKKQESTNELRKE